MTSSLDLWAGTFFVTLTQFAWMEHPYLDINGWCISASSIKSQRNHAFRCSLNMRIVLKTQVFKVISWSHDDTTSEILIRKKTVTKKLRNWSMRFYDSQADAWWMASVIFEKSRGTWGFDTYKCSQLSTPRMLLSECGFFSVIRQRAIHKPRSWVSNRQCLLTARTSLRIFCA